MRISKRRSVLATAALSGALILVTSGSALLWTKVYCYSCVAAPGTTCRFNGQNGTWGPDETINGVTYNVCIAARIVNIHPNDAFTTDKELREHAEALKSGATRPRT